jgi:hypothetical protein
MEVISERCRSHFISGVKRKEKKKKKQYEKANNAKFPVHIQSNESPVPVRYQALSAPDFLRRHSVPYAFIQGHALL